MSIEYEGDSAELLKEPLTKLLTEKQQQLTSGFRAGLLQRPFTVFQFQFDDGAPFSLEVETTTFRFCEGLHLQTTVTLLMDNHATCWGLLEGSLGGMQAFMEGRYRADGNIVLSQLMLHLFRATNPVISYEVRD